MNIKERLKGNRFLRGPFRSAKKCVYFLWVSIAKVTFSIQKELICKGVIAQDERFKRIESLHNKYAGKRCFIIATGPSLTIDDLQKLKNEYTISMNSIVNILDKTDFRPNIYMCQDKSVYNRIKRGIVRDTADMVLLGVGNMGPMCRSCLTFRDVKDHKETALYRVDTASIYYQVNYDREKFQPEFSFDCGAWIGDGTTITYSAIQLAAYMGFTSIYLVGVDCNYGAPKAHIDDYDAGVVYDKAEEMYINNSKAYKQAFEELRKVGVALYNATRGGALQVLPRVELDDILS